MTGSHPLTTCRERHVVVSRSRGHPRRRVLVDGRNTLLVLDRMKRVRCQAHGMGPPWDIGAFTNWSAINHFDQAIDEKTKELQKQVVRFEQTYYTISVGYWGIWLAAMLSGNTLLTKMSQFKFFCFVMCISSVAFSSWFAARCIKDVYKVHDDTDAMSLDLSGFYRYGWRALFWLAFVLFYIVPTYPYVANVFAIPGAVMCLYGLVLIGSAAAITGTWSFMSDPNVPLKLITVGPFAVVRHPNSLGNMLFLIGFALSGGSLCSALSFIASFALYCKHIIPLEEEMLTEAFPSSYTHYKERVPAFSWALIILLVIIAVLMWRFGFSM